MLSDTTTATVGASLGINALPSGKTSLGVML
jgi:hypothetical protein